MYPLFADHGQNSPYAEVRANVEATDDPTMPALTIRVWVIGCIFAAAGSFIDSFFLMRNPPVYIGANVAQLLSCEWRFSSEMRPHADLHRSMRKVHGPCLARLPIQAVWT